jgi:hypothetical protein
MLLRLRCGFFWGGQQAAWLVPQPELSNRTADARSSSSSSPRSSIHLRADVILILDIFNITNQPTSNTTLLLTLKQIASPKAIRLAHTYSALR